MFSRLRRHDLFRCDRDNRKGGGVAIFSKRFLNPVRLPENLRAVEAVCIDLTVVSRQSIICVYRPQKPREEEQHEAYNEELAHVLRNPQYDLSTIDNQWETIKTTITIAAKATIGKREMTANRNG